jgi:hypothetical protein
LIAGEHAVVDLVERAGQVAHISRGCRRLAEDVVLPAALLADLNPPLPVS